MNAGARAQGLWLAALAAVLFSFKAIVAKLLYRHQAAGVDASIIIGLRMAFAGPVFAAIAVFEQRRARARAQQLSWSDCRLLLLLGFLGYYLSSFLDFWGLKYIGAALERLFLFLTPTAVALISMWLLKRRLSRAQWLAMAVSYAGVALVFYDALSVTGESVWFGSGLVFGAMLSYASYLVMAGEIIQRIGSIRLVAYVMTVSTALTAVHVLLLKPLATFFMLPAPVYWLSLVNSVFCTILPVYLTMFAVARVGATATSQMSMLGPVSLVFFGYWLLNEAISALQIVGTLLVLLGVWLLARPKKS